MEHKSPYKLQDHSSEKLICLINILLSYIYDAFTQFKPKTSMLQQCTNQDDLKRNRKERVDFTQFKFFFFAWAQPYWLISATKF